MFAHQRVTLVCISLGVQGCGQSSGMHSNVRSSFGAPGAAAHFEIIRRVGSAPPTADEK